MDRPSPRPQQSRFGQPLETCSTPATPILSTIFGLFPSRQRPHQDRHHRAGARKAAPYRSPVHTERRLHLEISIAQSTRSAGSFLQDFRTPSAPETLQDPGQSGYGTRCADTGDLAQISRLLAGGRYRARAASLKGSRPFFARDCCDLGHRLQLAPPQCAIGEAIIGQTRDGSIGSAAPAGRE